MSTTLCNCEDLSPINTAVSLASPGRFKERTTKLMMVMGSESWGHRKFDPATSPRTGVRRPWQWSSPTVEAQSGAQLIIIWGSLSLFFKKLFLSVRVCMCVIHRYVYIHLYMFELTTGTFAKWLLMWRCLRNALGWGEEWTITWQESSAPPSESPWSVSSALAVCAVLGKRRAVQP